MLETFTEHKYSKEQMQKLMLVAINSTSSGLVISDNSLEDNLLIFANPAFCEMTGYSEDEILGQNGLSLQSVDTTLPESAVIKKAIKDGKHVKVILKNFKKNGEMFWNELVISPVCDQSGKVTNFIAIQTDVTERIETQRVIKEKTRELELTNGDLGQFAHAIYHDLKEPLRMISTFVEFLAINYKDKLDERAQEYISYAMDGTKRMRAQIEGLLEYSELSSKDPEFREFDLNDVLAEVLTNLKLLFVEKKVKFDSVKLPIVKGIRSQFVTLLQNLISNAVKYTAEGMSPEIKLEYTELDDAHFFKLQDHGIGIDLYYHDYIFEIFNRLHPRESYAGNGIGLALCKRILERHNGQIWFESERGQGTCFFLQIPKNPDEALGNEKIKKDVN